MSTTVKRTIRLDKELDNRIINNANRDNMNPSEYVRHILYGYLSKESSDINRIKLKCKLNTVCTMLEEEALPREAAVEALRKVVYTL